MTDRTTTCELFIGFVQRDLTSTPYGLQLVRYPSGCARDSRAVESGSDPKRCPDRSVVARSSEAHDLALLETTAHRVRSEQVVLLPRGPRGGGMLPERPPVPAATFHPAWARSAVASDAGRMNRSRQLVRPYASRRLSGVSPTDEANVAVETLRVLRPLLPGPHFHVHDGAMTSEHNQALLTELARSSSTARERRRTPRYGAGPSDNGRRTRALSRSRRRSSPMERRRPSSFTRWTRSWGSLTSRRSGAALRGPGIHEAHRPREQGARASPVPALRWPEAPARGRPPHRQAGVRRGPVPDRGGQESATT